MDATVEWVNQLSVAWWNYTAQAFWQAAVVGTLLLGVIYLLGTRWPAPLRYACLVLALLKFACPPLMPIPTGLFAHVIAPRLILASTPERKPAQVSGSRVCQPNSIPVKGSRDSPGPRLETGVGAIHWTAWLMALHVLGTAAVVLMVARQALRLRHATRRASPLRLSQPMSEQYRNLALQLGLFQIPSLAVSDAVDGPLACGARRPAILLPAGVVEHLTPAELRGVLAHELAHCHRGDLWLNWVQIMLVALWWFHPVLWLLNRGLREVREDCCDDLLLARGIMSNDAYCDLLLRAASESLAASPLTASLGLFEADPPLGRRLIRISDWTIQRCESVSAPAGAIVLLAAALLWPGIRSQDPSHADRAKELPSRSLMAQVRPTPPLPTAAPEPVQAPRKPAAKNAVQARTDLPVPLQDAPLRSQIPAPGSTPRAPVSATVPPSLVIGTGPPAAQLQTVPPSPQARLWNGGYPFQGAAGLVFGYPQRFAVSTWRFSSYPTPPLQRQAQLQLQGRTGYWRQNHPPVPLKDGFVRSALPRYPQFGRSLTSRIQAISENAQRTMIPWTRPAP